MVDRLDLQQIAAALRRMGWIRLWAQVVLAVVVVGVLLFNNIGGQVAMRADKALGLGPGLSFTTLAFFVLLWSIWQSGLLIRCGRALASPVRPSKGETARLIKRGVLADLVGLSLAAVGYQALAGSLFLGLDAGRLRLRRRDDHPRRPHHQLPDHLPGDALGAEQHPGAVRPSDRANDEPLAAAAHASAHLERPLSR
jgi:hypothetical protein